MHATPITLVRHPGPNFAIIPIALTVIGYTSDNTPWSGGGSIGLVNGLSTQVCNVDPGVLTGADTAISYSLNTGMSAVDFADYEDTDIKVTNDTGAFTGGTDSSAEFFLVYELVKLA